MRRPCVATQPSQTPTSSARPHERGSAVAIPHDSGRAGCCHLRPHRHDSACATCRYLRAHAKSLEGRGLGNITEKRRLAQQVVKHVNYDAENGFDLPCRQDPPEPAPVIRTHEHSRMPVRTLPSHPQQITLFVETAKDVGFGVGAAWRVRDGWKSKAMSLGKYLTEVDAVSFAIGIVFKDLPAILSRTDHQRAEIVTKSRLALVELENSHPWLLRTITDSRRQHAKRVGEEGGAVALTWFSSSTSSNGGNVASTAVQRVANWTGGLDMYSTSPKVSVRPPFPTKFGCFQKIDIKSDKIPRYLKLSIIANNLSPCLPISLEY